MKKPAFVLRDMSTAEVAEALDVSDQTVRTLAREGVLTRSGRHFQYPEVIRQYARHMRGLTRERGGESAIEAGAAARARVATLRGDRMQFELDRERGEMVNAADFQEAMTISCRALRIHLMLIPQRISGRAPHLTRGDIGLIDDEVRAALTEVSTMSMGQLREIAAGAKELAPPPQITGRRDDG
jgi:phage terminase Nu1 subunit (DNA packaging protein)